MPSDDVWTHLIDGFAQSPIGLLLMALIVALIVLAAAGAYVVVNNQPHKRDVREKELELQAQREKRKADEVRMRNEDAIRQAELRAREIANSEQIAQTMDALTVQTAALTARLEESATHSKKMGDVVEDTNGKVTSLLPKIDEVHDFLLRGRD